jgi:predicted acylesterase/phospholipase RssA
LRRWSGSAGFRGSMRKQACQLFFICIFFIKKTLLRIKGKGEYMRTPTKIRAFRTLQVLVFVCLSFTHALYGQETAHARKRIGLALSGGGARGGAHIGILKALEEQGIEVDLIVGTSIGAIIGGLYASGHSPDEIERLLVCHWQEVFSNQAVRTSNPLMQHQKQRQALRIDLKGLKPSLPAGMLTGQKAVELFGRLTLESMLEADYDFNRLRMPFWAVATNLNTGEPYIFKKGRISEAVYASFAEPIVFLPVRKDGLLLVDGGLAANLPTKIAKEMGADYVIAVDVTSTEPNSNDGFNLLQMIERVIRIRTIATTKPNYQYADLVIKPNLAGFTGNDFGRLPEIIAIGNAAAADDIGKIRELVERANPTGQKKSRPANIEITAATNSMEEIRELSGRADLLGRGSPPPALRNRIIHSITFETASLSQPVKIPSSALLPQIKSKPGQRIHAESLTADVARLYATGMFDMVDYECRHVADDRYELVFLLKESSPNSLGLSLRYDREYHLQALTELTTRNVFGTGSYGVISARFGETEHKTATLRLIHPRFPALFIEPQAQMLTRELFEFDSSRGMSAFLDRRRGAQVMMGATIHKRFEISAGYRFETERFVLKGIRNDHETSTNLSGLSLRLRRDTLDHQEFPRSGMDL